ncbi:MAG: PadR family transcriptional regulator [Thermomicrobiales bacterium]
MSSTRLLILGALRFMQPTYGYEVRRELESWHAEEWANIAYGSIYFALNKMAEEGLVAVQETDQVGKRPARTTYVVTEKGETEFQRLVREYWWEFKPVISPFRVAVAFMDQLSPDELIGALRHRASIIQAGIAGMREAIATLPLEPDKPRHVAEIFHLLLSGHEAELQWIEQALAKVQRGDLP